MSALLPVALDLARLSVAVIGNGPRVERRSRLLLQAGASDVDVYAVAPDDGALAQFDVVFVAGLPAADASAVAERARRAGALVNVEDAPAECDFQSAAVVRRGDLALGVWTGGQCPMLARVLREWLDRLLPADFARVVERLAEQRRRLRAASGGNLVLESAAQRALTRLNVPSLPAPAPLDA